VVGVKGRRVDVIVNHLLHQRHVPGRGAGRSAIVARWAKGQNQAEKYFNLGRRVVVVVAAACCIVVGLFVVASIDGSNYASIDGSNY
jgi:hypothetical protein